VSGLARPVPRAVARGQYRGFVGAQPCGFPYGVWPLAFLPQLPSGLDWVGGVEGWGGHAGAMVALLALGCTGSAQDESRAYLGRGGARSRALRVRGVGLDPVVRRGGGDDRRGGERRALHDPISLLIVVFEPACEEGDSGDGFEGGE